MSQSSVDKAGMYRLVCDSIHLWGMHVMEKAQAFSGVASAPFPVTHKQADIARLT